MGDGLRAPLERWRHDPTAWVALSLFVILLCFFVVLTRFSQVEEGRVAAAMRSLSETFSPGRTDPFNAETPWDGEMRAWHAELLPVLAVGPDELRRVADGARIELPAERFFLPGTAIPGQAARETLAALARTLPGGGGERRRRLLLTVGGGDRLAVARALAAARALESAGAPSGSVLVGEAPLAAPLVRLDFALVPQPRGAS